MPKEYIRPHGDITEHSKNPKAGETGKTDPGMLILPPGTTDVHAEAFKDRTDITEVYLPEGLTKIGNCSFQGCTSLKTINLPQSLTEIGYFAFEGCTDLSTITIDTEDEATFNRIKNLLPSKLHSKVFYTSELQKIKALQREALRSLCDNEMIKSPANDLQRV